MQLPKISIITPSYNQAAFLEATLQSVLNQNYPNLEYIVLDGGSIDGSVEILEQYGDRLSGWVSEPDKGQTDALIKGFSRATGDILGWLCSDDLLEPNTLHEVAEFFCNNAEARVVYGDSLWINTAGEVLKQKKELPFNRSILLYGHNFIPQPSTFWRRELYEEVGGLDPRFDVAMDADLWLRFSEVTTLWHVRRFWSCMRIYPEQKTYRLLGRREEEKRILRERYFGDESNRIVQAKQALAKLTRLSWKVSAGCYW